MAETRLDDFVDSLSDHVRGKDLHKFQEAADEVGEEYFVLAIAVTDELVDRVDGVLAVGADLGSDLLGVEAG